jgi:hypothetical protein
MVSSARFTYFNHHRLRSRKRIKMEESQSDKKDFFISFNRADSGGLNG